jgi:hypothetical protein
MRELIWYRREPEKLEQFLDDIRQGVEARGSMKQDILRLRSGGQQDLTVFSAPFEELSDTDMWSSTQSMGSMAPTDRGSQGDGELTMRYDEDRALDNLLRAFNGDFTQRDLARLVFHWTNVRSFGDFERHELTSPL